MQYRFFAFGHPNIQATHKTTLEFTKDKNISLKGDCIVGVNADFNLTMLKNFIKKINNKELTIKIKSQNNKKLQERMTAEINSDFDSNKELVIRKTNFVSDRTFAIKADKAAFELNRDLISYLKDKKNRISIIIENK